MALELLDLWYLGWVNLTRPVGAFMKGTFMDTSNMSTVIQVLEKLKVYKIAEENRDPNGYYCESAQSIYKNVSNKAPEITELYFYKIISILLSKEVSSGTNITDGNIKEGFQVDNVTHGATGYHIMVKILKILEAIEAYN